MTEQKKQLRVDVISDVVCPWCYVGKRHLEQAIASTKDRYDVQVVWHPYQLTPEMPPEGKDWDQHVRDRFGSPERLAPMQERLREVGGNAGIPFAFEKIRRAANTFDAHRLILLAGTVGKQDEMVEGLFRAYFVDGRDVGDRDTLVAVASEAGLDEDTVKSWLDSNAAADGIRNGLSEARRVGVQGVPFFIVDGKLAVSGAHPPEAIASLFDRAAADDS